jgi:hypothetical protein
MHSTLGKVERETIPFSPFFIYTPTLDILEYETRQEIVDPNEDHV